MITAETILLQFHELSPADLDRWIGNAWVRPLREAGTYHFAEIDVARIRLILDLRDHLEVAEPALPTVLSLLDQIYDMRRQMRRLNEALGAMPEDIRVQLLGHLTRHT